MLRVTPDVLELCSVPLLKISGILKEADIVVNRHLPHVESAGLFVGGGGGEDDDHEDRVKVLTGLIHKHKSLQTARREYEKLHPDHFITAAFKMSASPVTSPRIVVHAGRTATGDQSYFYNTVLGSPGKKKTAAELTERGRAQVKDENFVFPEEKKYPIHDRQHAESALGFSKMHGSPEVREKVRAAVAKKYPGLSLERKPKLGEKLGSSRLRKAVEFIHEVTPPRARGTGFTHHTMTLDGHPIGQITVHHPRHGSPEGALRRVVESELDPKYRGMGLGSKLYGEVLKATPGHALESDSQVSELASRVWERMGKKRGYEMSKHPAARLEEEARHWDGTGPRLRYNSVPAEASNYGTTPVYKAKLNIPYAVKEAAAPKKEKRRPWNVANHRTGKRPMSVHTMLRKEKDGTLNVKLGQATSHTALSESLVKIAWFGNYYHGASPENETSILQEGLKASYGGTERGATGTLERIISKGQPVQLPEYRRNSAGAVHVSPSKTTAKLYGLFQDPTMHENAAKAVHAVQRGVIEKDLNKLRGAVGPAKNMLQRAVSYQPLQVAGKGLSFVRDPNEISGLRHFGDIARERITKATPSRFGKLLSSVITKHGQFYGGQKDNTLNVKLGAALLSIYGQDKLAGMGPWGMSSPVWKPKAITSALSREANTVIHHPVSGVRNIAAPVAQAERRLVPRSARVPKPAGPSVPSSLVPAPDPRNPGVHPSLLAASSRVDAEMAKLPPQVPFNPSTFVPRAQGQQLKLGSADFHKMAKGVVDYLASHAGERHGDLGGLGLMAASSVDKLRSQLAHPEDAEKGSLLGGTAGRSGADLAGLAMMTAPTLASMARGTGSRFTNAMNLAGLSALAAPTIDNMQAHIRARRAGVDPEKKMLMGHKAHALLELGGLGTLSAPVLHGALEGKAPLRGSLMTLGGYGTLAAPVIEDVVHEGDGPRVFQGAGRAGSELAGLGLLAGGALAYGHG